MSYEVQPAKLSFDGKEWLSSSLSVANVGCSGCGAVIVSLILLTWASKALLPPDPPFPMWFRYFAAGAILAYVLISLVVYVVRKARRNSAQARQQTTEALALMDGVKKHADYLTYKANAAAQTLKAAAVELKEEAFTPFWDAIERAAGDLGECQISCEWISTSAPKYDEVLRGRMHNFPDCFQGIETLPDCRPLLEEFYRLVRLAQRDFRFANIWEHRQTRKVMIAGFASLGEAIRSLEATVARSMAELRNTIETRPLQAGSPAGVARIALRLVIPFP
ncbi:MAG: hypothetical protein ABUT39_20185 [Acidobacteriota bacterium]